MQNGLEIDFTVFVVELYGYSLNLDFLSPKGMLPVELLNYTFCDKDIINTHKWYIKEECITSFDKYNYLYECNNCKSKYVRFGSQYLISENLSCKETIIKNILE